MNNIQKIKKTKEILKEKFLINGLKCVQLGNKKNKLNNSIEYLKNLNKLKEIIDVIKVLSNNSEKFELVNELILKGKNILNSFPKNVQKNLRLFNAFEEEFNKFTGKSSENMIEEFKKLISNFIIETFEISNEINSDDENKVFK
jgi:hypothetical protein